MFRIIILLLFISIDLAAQSSDTSKTGTFKVAKKSYYAVTPEGIVITVDQMPQFPGGEIALMQWIMSNVKVPDTLKNRGIQGTVYIQFTINENGKVKDVTLARGIPPLYNELNQIAIKVVQSMPDWTPAIFNENPLAVRYTLPIKFTLK
jgi:protein TonB